MTHLRITITDEEGTVRAVYRFPGDTDVIRPGILDNPNTEKWTVTTTVEP
jgi:hypothetical protein